MIRRLIYSSSAADDLSERDVTQILESARGTNGNRGITGILFIVNGEFLQVLEGSSDAVSTIYETIAKDPRHGSVQLLVDEEAPNRYFSQWAMAYALIDDNEARKIGGSFNVKTASEFVSYVKRPDAYLADLFKNVLSEITQSDDPDRD